MLQKIFWVSCSLLLISCAKITRPDSDLCVMNVPGKKLTCYNLKRDFNDSGEIKPGAQPHFKPVADLGAINKHVVIDPDSFANLKVYVRLLREEYERGCKNP